MSSINYSEKIPNNVNLSEDRTLQRALEQWQPNYLSWWQDMGPDGSQDFDVYLRTAVSVDYRLDLIDTNAAPTISLINAVTTLPESTSTASRIRVADLVISDDGEGTNTISLEGDDREDFEIEAGSLYLKAGTELDYETGPSRSVSVVVADALLVGVPASRASYTLTISDVNERPTSVSLANAKASLPENTNTAVAIKVADILIVDQDAGTNTVTLAGPNAVSFQVVGAALYLRAGAVLSAGSPPLAVTVRVADATADDATPVSVGLSLTATPAVQGPTATLTAGPSPLETVTGSFSRAVTGVDLADFGLTRDGQPVSLVGDDTGNYNTAPASGQVAEAMVATLELQATKAPEPNEVVPSGSFLNLAFTAMAVEQDATRSLNAKKRVFEIGRASCRERV